MEYSKEEVSKNIKRGFEDLKIFGNKIKNNFSSIELIEESKEKYYLITFLNYFFIRGQIGLYKNIENFIYFFDLVDWNKKDKFTYFYHHYGMSYLNFFELKGNEEICEKYSIKDFFEKGIYLSISDEDLEKVYIGQNRNISLDDFIKYFYKNYINGLYESVYYTYYENELMDCKYNYDKKIIINTLSYLYSVHGEEFEIREEMFNKKGKIDFSKFLISYYYVEFINISGFPSKENKFTYKIKILSDLQRILDEVEEKRELIMDKVFDDKYKEIKIRKKNGKLHLLEGNLEFIGDENKFVELRKKFPNSEINTKNYKGKTQKYEVKEKIRFDNKDK